MFNNYIKSALRFLMQNKVFASINALGLSIALATSFIILLFVINELSYDNFHENKKQVFRVLNYYIKFDRTITSTPYILATALKKEFPQVQKAIRVAGFLDFKLKLNNEIIDIPETVATDPDVFEIFTIKLVISPSAQDSFDDINTLIISRKMANRIFPDQNPIGKEIIGLVNGEEHIFIVKNIFEDIPENSTFRAQCLISSRWTIEPINKISNITDADVSWDQDFCTTWLLLSKDCNINTLQQQFETFEKKYMNESPQKHYSLQNLSDVYLGSDDVLYSEIKGNINNIKLFSIIAFLIVLVAALNYIILSTAVSTGRAKEIGIRKTSGAENKSIRNQLLSESILLCLIILPISLVIMFLALPFAGKLFQTNLYIISSNLIIYISVYFILVLLIGFASGIYTSYFLSRLKVIDIFKNTLQLGKRRQLFRTTLIIIQLVIFCSFVSSTLIIRSQYKYAISADAGYYTNNILLIDIGNYSKEYKTFINSIKSNPNVIMVSGAMERLPSQSFGAFLVQHYLEKDLRVEVEGMAVDYNYLKTMGLTLLEGRDFSEDFGSDMTNAAILNETATKRLGITDPIGKKVGSKTIIGVVKDFNLHSIHSAIPPVLINLTDQNIHQVAVHYRQGTINNLLPYLKAEWKNIVPDTPFSYSTIEELIRKIYTPEKNMSTIASVSAFFTLLISALGLFGLTLFTSKTRIKEIGIKKIFGSSEQSIVYSFLRGNFINVLLAALLSIPITLYFMTDWLNNFAYKARINYWVFAIAFIIAVIVVLLTVLIHSYKTSRINPVKALKYE